MNKRSKVPVALTIAGSDSGGGAGIQADLKTFAALGVHGTSAICCITAQNPKDVLAIQPTRPEVVRQQMRAVFDELTPAAVKTGMLYSAPIIRAVVEFLRDLPKPPPIVLDPVMVATSGARLLKPAAIRLLQSELIPLATLVTPNLDEAEILAGMRITSVEEMRQAARTIRKRFGCAVLVKGGHLGGLTEAVDIFLDARSELLLSAPFVRHVSTHGTGCTYSAAIAAHLAKGFGLAAAVEASKEFVSNAIASSHRAAGLDVLNPFWSVT